MLIPPWREKHPPKGTTARRENVILSVAKNLLQSGNGTEGILRSADASLRMTGFGFLE